ncbi:hypothetical protein [Methylomonas fluvii]|nr:hypothetical protein [Methylomonas fluvii]
MGLFRLYARHHSLKKLYQMQFDARTAKALRPGRDMAFPRNTFVCEG